MNIKKCLLIGLFIGCLTANLYAEIYPPPLNFTVSKGEYADSIKVRWSAPTPPEFGEGFEAGIVPPEGWDTIATNLPYSWQIIDHPAYAHSGSYAACVPYTFSEGEFEGFGENLVTNGDFSEWIDTLPQYWHKSTEDIIIDSLAQDSLYLAFSASFQTFRYVYQGLPVDKYAKYKLTFTSKQDSLEETYKIELYNKTDNKVLWSKEDLNNLEWKTFEFDIHTSSCDSLEIRLYPSKQGNTTYWDNISFEKYIYETPNQDEWLISPNYSVKSDDELTFWLGTSKTYGVNSPVYVLALQEGEVTDTLLVCDGSDHLDGLWEYKEYSLSLEEFENSEIQIAFRYLGGNGDLVCLDDVGIGGERKTDLAFFVTPVEKPTTRFASRAPINTKNNKATVLTGYSLERRFWDREGRYEEIFSTESLTDTLFFDTNVGSDTAYVYRGRAIYNNVIPSEYTAEDSLGYVIDNNPPNQAIGVSASFDDLAASGIFTLNWRSQGWLNDTIWVNPSRDLQGFKVYDTYEDTTIFASVDVNFETSEYKIERSNSLPARPHILSIASIDVAGNESALTEPVTVTVLPPPSLTATSDTTDLENKIRLSISKYYGEDCIPADSIRIYKGIDPDPNSMHFFYGFRPSDSTKTVSYIDTAVVNGTEYSYYATFMYDLGESTHSITRTVEPEFVIHNIENLTVDTTETGLLFSWEEPDDPDYAGVYLYTHKTYPKVEVDSVSVGTTSTEFSDLGVYTFYFVPFDWQGNRDFETEIILENLNVGLTEVTENFDSGFPPNWGISYPEGGDGIWKTGKDGSSQWFEIPEGDSIYVYINDDSLGQFGTSNCYLMLPEISGLTPGDKVFLQFDSYFKKEYDGSAYIALKDNENWSDIIEISEDIANWSLHVIDLSSYIPDNGTLQIAFHYDDKGTWSQGWAIDNVSILTTSTDMKTTLGEKIVIDAPFKIWTNYPNPFSQSTNFSFYLNQPATVSLEIYNILGQKVRTIEKGKEFPAGKNYLRWDGKTDAGKRASPGIYLYRIDVDGNSRVNKMMLLR